MVTATQRRRAVEHLKSCRVSERRAYRIYCEESLQVRPKKRKKITRPRVPMLVPDAANQRWSMDF